MSEKIEQAPLLEANAQWFHVFRSMLDSFDIAKMGPHATTVYLAIKAYTNWKTGKSWPGIELLVERTGISKRQVLRSLIVLEEFGYISKEKSGRHNVYRLREKISVFDTNAEDMRPVAEASWDYLPSTVKDAVAELKKFVVTGEHAGLNVIQIENLTLNIQQNIECRDVAQHNIGQPGSLSSVDWDSIPDDDPVKRAFFAQKAAKARQGE